MSNSLEIDHAVFYYFFSSKQMALEVVNKTNKEYFDEELYWLYDSAIAHFSNPKFKVIPTNKIIKDYLEKMFESASEVDEKILEVEKIRALGYPEEEFSWYLEKLKFKYNRYLQKKCFSSIKETNLSNPDESDKLSKINDLLKETVSAISLIDRIQTYKEGSLDQSAKERVSKYKEVETNPLVARGMMSGFREFDRITNGMHRGELIIVGGNTGTGKSIVMHNMAVNAYLDGVRPLESVSPEQITTGANVLYFSLEMPKEKQEMRIDACMAGVEMNKIRDGRLSDEEKDRYFKTLKFQSLYPKIFHIVDVPRGLTVNQIEMIHQEQEQKRGVKFDLMVVDYMGIMKPNEESNDSDWLMLGAISEELHEYARAYNIPVITGTQLNRPKDPAKQNVGSERIARSSMIPTNANVIVQIGHRGEDEHTRSDMPIYFVKNRDGELTSFTLLKNFQCMQVKDMLDIEFAGDEDD